MRKKKPAGPPGWLLEFVSLKYFAFASNPASEYSITNPYQQVKKKMKVIGYQGRRVTDTIIGHLSLLFFSPQISAIDKSAFLRRKPIR